LFYWDLCFHMYAPALLNMIQSDAYLMPSGAEAAPHAKHQDLEGHRR
jgi:hypothetical protein